MLKKTFGTGPQATKLLLVDDLPPEDMAMVQALYSRSAESAEKHIEQLYADRRDRLRSALREHVLGMSDVSSRFEEEEKVVDLIDKAISGHASDKARSLMARWFVGYNHRSIGDCGVTYLFAENVSMLAAKAVQDNPLYSGQETSSRYIDMSKQRIVDPVGTTGSSNVLGRWLDFYVKHQKRVFDEVARRHPRKQGESEAAYEGAVHARKFDIMRAFLSAGTCTQLSWTTSLRQAGDKLGSLVYHPSEEIAKLGEGLRDLLLEQYQSSAQIIGTPPVSGVSGRKQAGEEWEAAMARKFSYQPTLYGPEFQSAVAKVDVERYADLLADRPRGRRLPHFMSDFGQMTWQFLLDFGSFRDIQRQRNGVCRMPLLSTLYGFEEWYLAQLDDGLRVEAEELIAEQKQAINLLTDDWVVRQYYTALGFRVPVSVTYALPAAVYVMELRSGKTIHPTLRKAVHGMIAEFQARYPNFKLHADLDPDDWTVRRGTQTISEKKS